MGSTGDLSLKWNPKNLEIKTRTVERTLEPLVMQVCLNVFTFHHDILPGTIQKDSLSKNNCHVRERERERDERSTSALLCLRLPMSVNEVTYQGRYAVNVGPVQPCTPSTHTQTVT